MGGVEEHLADAAHVLPLADQALRGICVAVEQHLDRQDRGRGGRCRSKCVGNIWVGQK
jgi:hypothetical protein